ncbi:MAG: hypothetical protein ACOY3D_01120 [Candidatus Omnitrophota bacterium]
MRLLIGFLLFSLVFMMPARLLAEPEKSEVNKKIEALENQITALQVQLDELKQTVASQSEDKETLEAKVKNLESGQKSFLARGMQSGGFKLKDAMGLGEESKLNIAGEINLRYRENLRDDGSKPGFELYEVEFFVDSEINKNANIFVELPIMHSNKPDLGNTWVDIHREGELAATDYTGLMIGNFMPWFSYYGYDDNQSWIYGGRTTTNTALVRSQKIDGQIIRDRQIGIAGNLRLGSWLLTQQVFNGAGPFIYAGGADNDRRKDFVSRVQYTLPEDLGVVGGGFWYAPKTRGATANSEGTQYSTGGKKHVRDITRYSVFFKYPNVMQATIPDLSLGGKPFVVYGEYHWGRFHANKDIAAFNNNLDYQGAWIETNFNIKRDKLVGIFRTDWFKPDQDSSQNLDWIWGLTPGIKWQILNQMYLTATYEWYKGGEFASGKNDDRFTLELATQF